MKFGLWATLVLGLLAGGCSGGSTDATPDSATTAKSGGAAKPLVAFAQANSQDPWRQVFDAGIKAEAAKHPDLAFEEQDATDKAEVQSNQIDTFVLKSPKALLVSAATEAVQQSVEKAFDKGIPVILLDRSIPGDKFTAYIGGDNVDIGRQAGEWIGKKLNGKGTVLMIEGKAGAGPTNDRKNGAMESFKKYPGITVIDGDNCDFQREKARTYMESFIQKGQHIDAVYAHNDEMAIGARMAWDAHSASGGSATPLFVGIDGCQMEVVDMIKAGKLDSTFQYPTPGAKGLEMAAQIIKGEMPKEKRIILPTRLVTKETADAYVADNPNLYAKGK